MADFDNFPDPPLTPQQAALADGLGVAFVAKVDAELFANTDESWRKIALVVGLTMMNESLRGPDLPDIYYAMRIRELVRSGFLEAAGNIDQMRRCEVRRK